MMKVAGSGQRVDVGPTMMDLLPDICFSGSSMVDTKQRGQIQLRDLKLNDSVLTFTPGVGSHFTEVS